MSDALRKITHPASDHNRRRRGTARGTSAVIRSTGAHPAGLVLATVLLCGLALSGLGLGGCTDAGHGDAQTRRSATRTDIGSEAQTDGGAAATDVDGGPAPVTLGSAGLQAWLALARAHQSGRVVNELEYRRLLALPGYDVLSKARDRTRLNPIILNNVMTYTFAPRDAAGRRVWQGRKPKREDLLVNFEFARTRLDELEALPAELAAAGLGQKVYDLLRPVLPPGRLPASLRIHLMLANNAILVAENDDVYVDAGLVLALENRDLLPNLIAADVYRSRSGLEDHPPQGTDDGPTALRLTFRKLRMEGITAWLGRLPEVRFSGAHPILAKTNGERADVVATGALAMTRSIETLQRLLDPKQNLLDAAGGSLDETLRVSGAYPLLGYAMTALIADRDGEKKVGEVSGSTLAFLEAYQAAAKSGKGTYELGDLPAFPPDLFDRLRDFLASG